MPVGLTGGEVGDAWQRNEKESEKRVNDYFTLPSTANTHSFFPVWFVARTPL